MIEKTGKIDGQDCEVLVTKGKNKSAPYYISEKQNDGHVQIQHPGAANLFTTGSSWLFFRSVLIETVESIGQRDKHSARPRRPHTDPNKLEAYSDGRNVTFTLEAEGFRISPFGFFDEFESLRLEVVEAKSATSDDLGIFAEEMVEGGYFGGPAMRFFLICCPETFEKVWSFLLTTPAPSVRFGLLHCAFHEPDGPGFGVEGPDRVKVLTQFTKVILPADSDITLVRLSDDLGNWKLSLRSGQRLSSFT